MLYRISLNTIRRSSGRSAVAASAYRSGQRLRDGRQGLIFFYRRRRERIRYTALVGWEGSREALWNAAEAAERRVDSLTARECVLTLFPELTMEANVSITHAFADFLLARYGVAIDIAIHSADVGPHAHILFTTRDVAPDGTFGARTLLDKRKGAGPKEVVALRDAWYAIADEAVRAAGFDSLPRSRSVAAPSVFDSSPADRPLARHNSQVQETTNPLAVKHR